MVFQSMSLTALYNWFKIHKPQEIMIITIISNSLVPYLLIVSLFLVILYFLSRVNIYNSAATKYTVVDLNKSFECGFDQFDKKYLGFCVQYIKTAFLFLLVDLEIALFLPLIINTPIYEKTFSYRVVLMIIATITLLLMLLVEMMIGGLQWKEDL